jgi:hypothetical protein
VLEGRSPGEYMPGYTSWIRREPVGVIGQVAPWNYPMMMAVWKFAPPLAAGNTVVLKPSDTTPVTSLLLAEIAAEFLPAGALNVVCGDRDTGHLVVGHRIPQMVSITGSVGAGIQVARAAWRLIAEEDGQGGEVRQDLVLPDVGVLGPTGFRTAGAGVARGRGKTPGRHPAGTSSGAGRHIGRSSRTAIR